MDTRMYVMTHKTYTEVDNPIYHTLHVGRALGQDLGYQGDETGDSISEKNRNYCELTGVYWVWKNVSCDYVGICHYRRFFIEDDDFLGEERIQEIMEDFDIISSPTMVSAHGYTLEHYKKAHIESDWMTMRQALLQLHPDYQDALELVENSPCQFFGNMWVTKKEIFDRYCEFLFPILFAVEEKIDLSDRDTYQARVFGFLSERLFRIWLHMNEYKIYEMNVKEMDPWEKIRDRELERKQAEIVDVVTRPLREAYIQGNYVDLFPINLPQLDTNGKIPVWVCWWQGWDQMPHIVRRCVESMERNLPEDKTEIRFICLDNVNEYMYFPPEVIEKFQAGKITMTHLSDILRAGLLYYYGGLWIDATYYMTEPLPEEFWTRDFATIGSGKITQNELPKGRWAGNFLYMKPGNLLARYMLNGFYIYWGQMDYLCYYYMIDALILQAYESFPQVKEQIDRNCFLQPNMFELSIRMNRFYRPEIWKRIRKGTQIYKLSYKREMAEKNFLGKETFYGHLFH